MRGSDEILEPGVRFRLNLKTWSMLSNEVVAWKHLYIKKCNIQVLFLG